MPWDLHNLFLLQVFYKRFEPLAPLQGFAIMLTVEGYICLLHAKSSTRESPTGADRNGFRTPQRLILKEELRMKKVLSLVLAFAMILGSFGFVFASNFSDVTDTEYYSEPVNVLSGFGVIAGYPDGTFQPTKVVTRAEMVTMIVAALNIPVKGGATTKRFSDVELNHWAAGFIDYGASVGFVAGYPDGTFQPEKEVSYNEALTMIVAALGYTAEALPGSWPGNFVNKAQSLGLLEICRTTGTAGAPRQDIACFLYKALTQPIGYVDKDGAFNANRGADGVVGHDTMMARLGATEYKGGLAFVVTGEEDSVINLKPYLGAFITAYQNSDEEIIAVKEVKSEFIEGAYKSSGQTVDGKKFADAATLKAPVTEKEQKEWTGSYVGFLNGDVDASVTDWTYSADSVKVAAKLNGNKVVTVYSVQVWEADAEFMAPADVQDEIAEDLTLGGEKFALDEDDKIDVNSFEIVGKAALADIAEDDVVTLYLNKDDEIVKIEVCDDTIEGAVAKINTTTGAYTIGSKTYGLSDFATSDAQALAVKDEGTYYLNYAGDIHEFVATSDTNTNYAVVLSYGSEHTALDGDTAKIRLFLADKTTKDFVVKDFKNADGNYVVEDGLWTGTDEPNKGDLVKYVVNSSEKVTSVTAVTPATGEFKFDANGVINGKILKSGVAVFSDNGDDTYDVLDASALYGTTVKAYAGIDDGNGNLKAVLVGGISSGNAAWAMFISDDEIVADDAHEWTALYEGKVQTITVADGVTVSETTSGAAIMYTLVLDSNNIATSVKGFGDYTPAIAPDIVPITPTETTSVSGSVFTAEKENYSLAADADLEVYVYDESDDEWTAKTKSAMAGRATAFTKITLYDMDNDGKYDIVLIVKP